MEEVEMIVMNSSKLVEQAISLKSQGNIGIAFTYNEPTVWYEYVYDTAKLAKEYGLYNVLVTNGYISKEPLERLLPFIDAMNIDLKSYDGTFYRETLHGGLEEVKAAILQSAAKCHVEVTTLVLPGVNDSREEITRIASFLSSISRKIPLHLSRFFPRFEWKDRSPTSIDTLYELALVAECYLDHVYVGNV
jgi:pyruvate formate lyase activating enzyme